MPELVPVRAVRNGGLDHMRVPTRDEAIVAALLRERAGYVQRSLPDRVAMIDDELRRLGAKPPPRERAPKTTKGA